MSLKPKANIQTSETKSKPTKTAVTCNDPLR